MSHIYVWHGTAQAVTLHDDAGGIAWEGTLVPGRAASGLPDGHPFVLSWIDAGLLKSAPGETEAGSRRKTARVPADTQES